MSTHSRLVFAVLALAVAGQANAQQQGTLDATALAQDLLIPLHTQAADPVGGEYRVWAAGPKYKASFHDGFAFYPHLGPTAERHLPLAWRTESVTVGGEALPLEAEATVWSGLHWERRLGAVVEAYDVRREGVEQTFTLRQRPVQAGDLVITGIVTTPLHCAPVAAAQQALVFRNGTEEVIRYGAATAIDANGRVHAVDTSWDGARIRLALEGSFLAEAAFPLVVDPLTSPVLLHIGATALSGVTITAVPETDGRIVIGWQQSVTSTDTDVQALVMDRNFGGAVPLFADLSTMWASHTLEGAYVGVPQRWVLTLQRHFSANNDAIRIYVHDVASTTVNSGSLLGPAAPVGWIDSLPVVGGSRYGGAAFVAFQRTEVASGARAVRGVSVGVSPPTLLPEVLFAGGLIEPLVAPRITPMAYSSTGWVVAMMGTAGLRVAKVPHAASGGIIATRVLMAPGPGERFDGAVGLPALHLAGTQGRYLLNYVSQTVTGTAWTDRIRTLRFDWASTAANPTVRANRVLHTFQAGTGGATGTTIVLGGIDHDMLTSSHWAAAWGTSILVGTKRVDRFGYSGGVTETQSTAGLADVAFALRGADGSFPCAFPNPPLSPAQLIWGAEFTYPANALTTLYGTSCTTSVGVVTNRSFAGHEFYRVTMRNLAPGTLGLFVLGFVPDNVDLTPHGLPGCWLNLQLPGVGTFVAVSDSSGDAVVSFPLPDAPLLIGDIYSQWFHYDAAASPLPFRSYRGLRHQVR